jgi:predicted nucleic acid-binding protein
MLDSGPLALACARPGAFIVDKCQAWLLALEITGVKLLIPAIADYEVRPELLRVGALTKLRRLDGLRARFDYVDLSQAAMDQAAEFWAHLRGRGIPTAGVQDIDADAILAGQAVFATQAADTVTIATTNLRHLGRFPGVDAQDWTAIM